MSIRINKYLSEHGIASRRQADAMIRQGKVLINGKKAKLGDQIDDADQVSVLGKAKIKKPEKIYLMLNKPIGIITTSDNRKKDNIIDFVGFEKRVFPVGRLDVKSSGLILLTNDGELADRLTHPKYEHEKEYVVMVDKPLRKIDLGKLKAGIKLEDGPTLPAKVRQLGDYKFAIILKEGRNRQIRRMCQALGYNVTDLKRTRIANIKLTNFPLGHYRKLSQKEVKDLKRMLKMEG